MPVVLPLRLLLRSSRPESLTSSAQRPCAAQSASIKQTVGPFGLTRSNQAAKPPFWIGSMMLLVTTAVAAFGGFHLGEPSPRPVELTSQASQTSEISKSSESTLPQSGPDNLPLFEVSGELEHVFSVLFQADETVLSRITGLVGLHFAIADDGDGIRLDLGHEVPHPRSVTSVRIIRNTSIAEQGGAPFFLAPISPLPVWLNHRIITTYQDGGRGIYLIAWRNERLEDDVLTLWNPQQPNDPGLIIARSNSPILAAATQPVMHGIPDLSIVIWTRGRLPGEAVASLYGWTFPADTPTQRR